MGIITTHQSIPTTGLNIIMDNSVPCLVIITLKVMDARLIDGMHASLHARKKVSKTFSNHITMSGSPLIYITGEPTCPDSYNYIKLNGVNIRIGRKPSDKKLHWAKSYTDARDDCEKNGGFLAKISNAEELSAMKMLNGVWVIILFISFINTAQLVNRILVSEEPCFITRFVLKTVVL